MKLQEYELALEKLLQDGEYTGAEYFKKRAEIIFNVFLGEGKTKLEAVSFLNQQWDRINKKCKSYVAKVAKAKKAGATENQLGNAMFGIEVMKDELEGTLSFLKTITFDQAEDLEKKIDSAITFTVL